ncbi:MAG: alpha/beta hydrolase [Alphaproteobacteria bacterium]|jgi:pimeloyl-ACP methyl ester carboxylesterase|nr:alpha/beta hydrolase [Rhodospirillaceae bacterium]MDP6405060.1 alpha/beta hydrolase [Alphaproteobacteria bacterium]|tara:strand:+ start:2208 stop:3041 length:834 start_codon:yes stop_codon:yes gene_type:complete
MNGTSRFLVCESREIHFTEWGSGAEALIMWHGLARTGRDFDDCARHFAQHYRVICPDTLGRGRSQWAADAKAEYCFDFYGRIAVSLLDQLGITNMRWIGTSMGGLIGVNLAAGALKGRITHLVMNDVGPDIPLAAVDRISSYVGQPPVFDTMAELEDWFRTVYAPFGDNPDAFWQLLTATSYRRTDDGRMTVHYDPQIVSQFTEHEGDLDVWPAFDACVCPVLLLRGADSDVLPASVAADMTGRGPKARLVEFPGYGHAPTLNQPDQLAVIEEFLAG